MKDQLKSIADNWPGFVELRHHKRTSRRFLATKGRVDTANLSIREGVGVRALVDGYWGFASTADLSDASLIRAMETATANAKLLAKYSKTRKLELDASCLATEDFVAEGFDALISMSPAEKIEQVIRLENQLAKSSAKIHTAKASYSEIIEEKSIVTSDGAFASLKLSQPEFSLVAMAESKGDKAITSSAAAVCGDWNMLFAHPTLQNIVERTSSRVINLLEAKYPEGGNATCILSPSIVGLLCHEAVGHTVEADFVQAGSIAQGKIGSQIGSEYVTLSDTGRTAEPATGQLPFDDEGVKTQQTTIIKNGILESYLHNRESSRTFGVAPTGNARAWSFSDEPIIRMRNTYLHPGKTPLDDIISSTEEGFLLEGSGSGQADANGEFMFGTGWGWKIKDGKKSELLRNVTVSGIAFDTLKSVDAVSDGFQWDLGSGYCGKGQPAKVDAGGPWMRCQLNVGGRS